MPRIAELRSQGLTFEEISKHMKLNRSRVYRLFKQHSAKFLEEHLNDVHNLLSTYVKRHEDTQRMHKLAYQASVPKDQAGVPLKGKAGRVEILRDAEMLEHQFFDRLQRAGFLPQRKEEIEAHLNTDYKFVIVRKEEKKAEEPKEV